MELEEALKEQGKDSNDAKMLRIDKLAELGCCCFCTILYIANDKFIAENPQAVKSFESN